MRGIDYLTTRAEVDPRRIGALGCSGGGAVSALTGALDPRVAAIGVACYTTSCDTLLPTLGPQDGEQSIPHFIASGLDFPDWIELAAPRPYAVIATYSDMFPFAGARSTVMEARRFYALFDPTSAGSPASGAQRSVPPIPTGPALNVDTTNIVAGSAPLQFITGPGRHGALAPILGNIVGFFIQNLEPGADPMHPVLPPQRPDGAGDAPPPLAGPPKDALQVTPTGQVATSYPGSESVFTLNLKRAAKVVPANRPPLSGDELSAAIRKTSGITTGAGACEAEVGPLDQHVGHVVFHCGAGMNLQDEIAVPRSAGRHSAVMLLVPDSIHGDSAIARANNARFDHLAANGNLVLAITPRPSPPGTDDMKSPILGPFYLLSLRADLVSKTLIGMRVEDVLQVTDYLAHRRDVDPTRITATGSGHMGLVLLYAATLDAHIRHVTVDHVLSSYRSLLDAPLPIGAPEDIIPGVLRYYDIPDLRIRLGSRLSETNPLLGSDDLSQTQANAR
jgi:cephalosporin-C deacetylase-like acetyl esterase